MKKVHNIAGGTAKDSSTTENIIDRPIQFPDIYFRTKIYR